MAVLVWFRQDLRLHDNPALWHAVKQYKTIIPLYILADDNYLGIAQYWWLHHSLTALRSDLKKRGVSLVLKKGTPLEKLQQLIKQHNIEAVYWNRCYEPNVIKRDKVIKQTLSEQSIDVQSFNASLLQEPWEVKNKSGDFFKVFTPFWKQCLAQFMPRNCYPCPKFTAETKKVSSDSLNDWSLLPTKPDWAKKFERHWTAGEKAAQQQLKSFIKQGLADYAVDRDRPDKLGTSRLSPYLHFGEISPLQIWQAIEANTPRSKSRERYLAEIGWREFSYHLLYHFPKLNRQNFRDSFDKFPWRNDQKAFICWRRGQTGYPIVDAGMRELWETGYMHNRVRMIVASFLTKHLLIDWRKGHDWFEYTLLDADAANNAASWQWTAGCGADAAPYFRIFNPIIQGEKFDSNGEYVKKWVPELQELPTKFIHKPWEADEATLSKAGIVLGKDYPQPIVNHQQARERALLSYKAL